MVDASWHPNRFMVAYILKAIRYPDTRRYDRPFAAFKPSAPESLARVWAFGTNSELGYRFRTKAGL